MNQLEATQAIFERWRTTWPGLTSNVPSSLDNVVSPQDALPRAVVNIISLDSEQQTLGPRAKMLREGLIEVRLYGRKGVGRGELDQLATHARVVFERRKLGRVGSATTLGTTNRVKTFAATVNELRRDRDSGELWILSVTIPFEFVEVTRRDYGASGT